MVEKKQRGGFCSCVNRLFRSCQQKIVSRKELTDSKSIKSLQFFVRKEAVLGENNDISIKVETLIIFSTAFVGSFSCILHKRF